ncbi:SseB family protein [Micromonospora sp. WMMD730]|uniref:SseB family protein n=1 Tax=Micromonospora sp. WMMD730 TaxID=3404128 RepID=UPI003B92DD69
MTDWEPATEAETAMRDALHAGDQEFYFRILAGSELFLPVSGQALAGATPMGWGTWTTGGRTHVLAFTSAAAMHACLGSPAGPYRRSRYADLAAEWPNHEWWLAVNPGLPIEGYLPAWFVSQLSRGDVRLPGRAPGARPRGEADQTPVRTTPGGPADVEPTADLSAGWGQPRPASSAAAPPAGGGIRPATGASLTDERGRPVTPPGGGPPGGGPRTTTAGPPEQGRPAFPDPPAVPGTTNAGWPAVPRRRLLGEESAGPANGRTSFFEPSSARGATRSPRDNPLRSGERAAPPTRPGMGGQPFPRRRPAPTQPGEDEAARAFRVTDPPARPGPGNGMPPAGRSPDPLAEEPTRAFRVDPSGGEPTRAFHIGPAAQEEATRAFRTPPPAAEATQTLPRRQPTPDGPSSGVRQPHPPVDPFAAPAAGPARPTGPTAPTGPATPAGPARGEAEELSSSVAEPVSAPPVSRRGFMPIVIEGVILESRDLPVAPAPAPSAAQGPPVPPVVPRPAAAPFVPPAAPAPPQVPTSAPVPAAPPAGGPGVEDNTVNLNGTGGPSSAPGRPAAPGPVSPPSSAAPPSPAGPPPGDRSRPAPGDLWTPSAERAAAKARAEVAAAPPDVAAPPVAATPPVSAPTVLPPAPAPPTSAPAPSAPAAPVTGPAAGAQAWTAPTADAVPAGSAPAGSPAAGPVAPTPTGDAAGAVTNGAPARPAAGAAPTVAAPQADGVDPRSTPVDLWTPAAERAAQTSPAAPTTAAPTSPTVPPSPVASTAPAEPAPGPAAEPAPTGSTPPGTPSTSAGADTPTTADEPFLPANEVEENLLDAVGAGSTDGFLSTLLLARVLLPVNPDSAVGSRPGEPGFQWRTGTTDGETYVVVYTSPERLAEHDVPPVETIEVRFVQLIRRWPDPSWAFAVNPGTPVGAKLPGEQIVALASWAAEVGLGDEADVEPVAAAEAPAERTRYAPPVTDPSRPVVMQKAVAPSQLAYYLERGYDRVSGFVHRAGELAHLTTPAELHDALGLGYPDSPFARDAEATYVLRWPAYRPSLYRIPYGGQNEAAMRAMEGWVIERAPFRGNGFAPGESSDVVAEFKVDSARLPHGAQLWRIGTEGTERVIAILDTDALVWRRVGEP